VGQELLPLRGRRPPHRRLCSAGRRRVHNVGRPQHTVRRVGGQRRRRRPRQGARRPAPAGDRGGAGRDGALADGAERCGHGARRQPPPGQDLRPPRRVQVRVRHERPPLATPSPLPLHHYRLSVFSFVVVTASASMGTLINRYVGITK
jgi:hypothetical protein